MSSRGKRKGAGRPPGTTKPDTLETSVSFRCSHELKKWIQKIARQKGFRGYQSFLRWLVETYKHGGE